MSVAVYREEVTAEDMAAVERILESIDKGRRQKHSLLEAVANWKLALGIFKRFEMQFTLAKDRGGNLGKSHRAVLSSLLGMTECIYLAAEDLGDEELNRISFSRKALEANVGWIRSKYNQWYAPRDRRGIQETNSIIENARAATA